MVGRIGRTLLFGGLFPFVCAVALAGDNASETGAKETVDRLLSASKSGQADERKAATARLMQLGGGAVPELVRRLDERPEPWVEDEVASVLGAIGATEATTALVERVIDKAATIRWKMAIALTRKPRPIELPGEVTGALCKAVRTEDVWRAVTSVTLLAKDDHAPTSELVNALLERLRKSSAGPPVAVPDTGYSECGYVILEFVTQWEARGTEILKALQSKADAARQDAAWPSAGVLWLTVMRGNLGDRSVAEELINVVRTEGYTDDVRALAVRSLARCNGESSRTELERLVERAKAQRSPTPPPSHGGRRDIVGEAAVEALRALDRTRTAPKDK